MWCWIVVVCFCWWTIYVDGDQQLSYYDEVDGSQPMVHPEASLRLTNTTRRLTNTTRRLTSTSQWVTSGLNQDCTSACIATFGTAYSCYLPAMWAIDSLAKIQALGCTGTMAWDAGHSNGEPVAGLFVGDSSAGGWTGNVPFYDIYYPASCYFNIVGQDQSTCEASHPQRHRFCACALTPSCPAMNQVQK